MRRIATCLVLTCIAMAASAAFAMAARSGGIYVGKTRQHRTIRLQASAGQVRMRSFAAELRCRDGSVLVDQESGFEPTAVRGSRFHDKQFGRTDTVVFAGKIRGRKVTGTLRVRDRIGKVRCSSPTVKFTARGH